MGEGVDAPRIPLGVAFGAEGDEREVSLDFSDPETPHLLVAGEPATGKSTLARSILTHALGHPEVWEAHVAADLHASDYEGAAIYPSAAELLEAVGSLIEVRFYALQRLGVNSVLEANERRLREGNAVTRHLVIVEDADPFDEVAAERLGRLLRFGRAAGVHLVFVAGRNWPPWGADLSYLRARAILGKPSEDTRKLLLEDAGIPEPLAAPDPLAALAEASQEGLPGGEAGPPPGVGVYWREDRGLEVVRYYHHAPGELLGGEE